MREAPTISPDRLSTCLREAYGLSPTAITFLPIGRDFEAGVYRVDLASGPPVFLKVSARALDAASCLVPRYLRDLGIPAVVAPLPTREGPLWAHLDSCLLLLYPFIAGETGWATMTPAAWRETGTIFRRIHDAPLPPPADLGTPRHETFDPSGYAAEIRRLEALCLAPDQGPDQEPDQGTRPSRRTLRDSWRAHAHTIDAAVRFLELLGPRLRARTLPQVICHADLHPGNLLRDPSGGVHVIDWDEGMLAPRERDFIFVRELRAVGAGAFWEGYGPVEIDWEALTYFLWERAVQDIIACAQTVLERDDLGEESKLGEAHLLETLFGPQNTVAAAYEAASHLPDHLGLPPRME